MSFLKVIFHFLEKKQKVFLIFFIFKNLFSNILKYNLMWKFFLHVAN